MPLFYLIRPQQWVKNIFVFLPMFFAGKITDPVCWYNSLVAFVAFSFMASSIYCINDVVDKEADRLHPQKRLRPVASGRISVRRACIVATVMFFCSVATVIAGSHEAWIYAMALLVAYFILNIAYCIRLKRYAIIDVFIIAIGFVLRLALGGVMCGIWLSPWIVCLTFLLSLFLAFAKRRDDVIIYEEQGILVRRNVAGYNSAFMNQTLGILASITIVCYIIYSVDSEVEARLGSRYVYTTSIFVLAGVLRYLQIALVDVNSGSPTKIVLKDRFVQTCIAGWLLSFFLIIYL